MKTQLCPYLKQIITLDSITKIAWSMVDLVKCVDGV